jgi:hypothetical protein
VPGGPCGEWLVPFPRSHGFGVKLAQVSPCPKAFLQKKALVPAFYGDGLGFVGLELNRIGAGFSGSVNKLDCFV